MAATTSAAPSPMAYFPRENSAFEYPSPAESDTRYPSPSSSTSLASSASSVSSTSSVSSGSSCSSSASASAVSSSSSSSSSCSNSSGTSTTIESLIGLGVHPCLVSNLDLPNTFPAEYNPFAPFSHTYASSAAAAADPSKALSKGITANELHASSSLAPAPYETRKIEGPECGHNSGGAVTMSPAQLVPGTYAGSLNGFYSPAVTASGLTPIATLSYDSHSHSHSYNVRWGKTQLQSQPLKARPHSQSQSPLESPPTRTRKRTTHESAKFQCPQPGCAKLFSRNYNFKVHLETHSPSRAYPFPCTEAGCTRKFVRKTDLQRHYHSVHAKERNFRCAFCERFFARKDTLRRHTEDGCSKRFDFDIETVDSLSLSSSRSHCHPQSQPQLLSQYKKRPLINHSPSRPQPDSCSHPNSYPHHPDLHSVPLPLSNNSHPSFLLGRSGFIWDADAGAGAGARARARAGAGMGMGTGTGVEMRIGIGMGMETDIDTGIVADMGRSCL